MAKGSITFKEGLDIVLKSDSFKLPLLPPQVFDSNPLGPSPELFTCDKRALGGRPLTRSIRPGWSS